MAYFIIGLVVCAVQFALGEVTALIPVTGSFVRHCEVFVDPALSFAIGWNLTYGNWLSVSCARLVLGYCLVSRPELLT